MPEISTGIQNWPTLDKKIESLTKHEKHNSKRREIDMERLDVRKKFVHCKNNNLIRLSKTPETDPLHLRSAIALYLIFSRCFLKRNSLFTPKTKTKKAWT